MAACESDHRSGEKGIITLQDTGRTRNHTARSVEYIIKLQSRHNLGATTTPFFCAVTNDLMTSHLPQSSKRDHCRACRHIHFRSSTSRVYQLGFIFRNPGYVMMLVQAVSEAVPPASKILCPRTRAWCLSAATGFLRSPCARAILRASCACTLYQPDLCPITSARWHPTSRARASIV